MKRYTLRTYEGYEGGKWFIYDNNAHLLLAGGFDTFELALVELRRLNGDAN